MLAMANQSIFYHLHNKAMPMTMAMPVSSKPRNSSASKPKPVQSTAHIKTKPIQIFSFRI